MTRGYNSNVGVAMFLDVIYRGSNDNVGERESLVPSTTHNSELDIKNANPGASGGNGGAVDAVQSATLVGRSSAVGSGLQVLLAVIGGVAVGNLYWGQPLLGVIARGLCVSTGAASSLVALTQIGYAVGIVLIVPLGDVVNRRRLIPLMLVLSALALAACAAAPTFPSLLVAIAVLGVTTVAGQIVIPLAGDLADDASRGRVIGTVMTGFLAGTIISRTLSGLVAQLAGWRAIFIVAAVVVLLLAALAHRNVPTLPTTTRLG